jgi:predicted outer membrane protein
MNVSRREVLFAGAALPVAGLWVSGARGQERTVAPTGTAPAGFNEDPVIVAQVLIVGRKQIAKSQLAQQRSQNSDVRAFADAEVAEHRAIQTRLTDRGFQYPAVTPLPAPVSGGAPVDAVAGVPGNPPPAPTANRPVVPQPGTRPANNAVPPPTEPIITPPPAAGPHAATPLLSVGRVQLPVGESRIILVETQIGDQTVATFQQVAGALAGLAFDKFYICNQIAAHYDFFDRASVYRRHASPAVLPILDEAIPIIQRHIATLGTIMARLDAAR